MADKRITLGSNTASGKTDAQQVLSSHGLMVKLHNQHATAGQGTRERAVDSSLRTTHRLHLGDARTLDWIPDGSVHLVVTSPPYWTLKQYNDNEAQLGAVAEYSDFMDQLDKVWSHCFRALVPGGRLVCVVGDVCIARRRNNGRHMVVPLHADISIRARTIGFDYLTPILWHKIASASYEVENGSSFLGKPYEPNAIIKNDIEYLLMLRKPGGYRKPSDEQRELSKLGKDEHAKWFRSFWADIKGASTKDHPAPFPVELAYRLIRMFSFVGDTVLDPFGGTFSTALGAIRANRNSIINEIDPDYFRYGKARMDNAIDNLGGLFAESPQIELILDGVYQTALRKTA
jgi:site-specific DNA-methyltransferase (adenine-specific)